MSVQRSPSIKSNSVHTSASVKKSPSVKSSIRGNDAASVRSSRSTVKETAAVAPLTSSNLSRLETASVTSSQLTGKPPGSTTSRSTAKVRYLSIRVHCT